MRKKVFSILKSKKGITLMTLAITIIVILILAGVTISLVIGPEGLLSNAEKSVNAYKQAEANEIELLAHLSSLLNTSTNNDGGNSGDNINAGEIIEEIKTQIISSIYPVGSIYITTDISTKEEMSDKFGGTWEDYGQGRTLVGVGTSDKTFEAEEVGGESNHSLTIAEMPSHAHSYGVSHGSVTAGNNYFSTIGSGPYYLVGQTGTTSASGGSQPHNNMPPYVTVYMWKRIN